MRAVTQLRLTPHSLCADRPWGSPRSPGLPQAGSLEDTAFWTKGSPFPACDDGPRDTAAPQAGTAARGPRNVPKVRPLASHPWALQDARPQCDGVRHPAHEAVRVRSSPEHANPYAKEG